MYAAPVVAAVLTALVVLAVGLLGLPRSSLWVVALASYALIPVQWLPLPFPEVATTLSPAVFVVGVLLFRRLLSRTVRRLAPPAASAAILGFGAWLLVCVAASPYRAVSVGWMVSFGALALLPALLALEDAAARPVIRRAWIVLAACLGGYALVETFLLQANPVFDPLFARASPPLEQHWSVYRATTSLGHPVENGSFFALAVPLAVGSVIRRPSPLPLLALALALGGVVSSASRAALVAAVAGAALVLLAPPWRRGGTTRPAVRLVGLVVVAMVIALGAVYVSARAASEEASQSSSFRGVALRTARAALAESPIVGVGPGAASFSRQTELVALGGAGAFESFWLELAVAAGLPGLLLGVGLVLVAVGSALRAGAPDVAGALLAYVVIASAYNVLEGGRPGHIVLGLLLAMSFSARGDPPPHREGAPGSGRVPGGSIGGSRPRLPGATRAG